jgi:hypothetical protein
MELMLRSRFRLFLLSVVVLAGSLLAQSDEKEKDKKVSMVARTSPELREHFREMFSKGFTENMNEDVINRMLDDQIDQFVKRLVQKNQRLADAGIQLSQATDAALRRQWIDRIRDRAGDLEGTLRIWTDSLRPEKKLKEAENDSDASSIPELVTQVARYKKQIDQFLFPGEVAISVKELQSEGFRGTLKKIQHIAQALEK